MGNHLKMIKLILVAGSVLFVAAVNASPIIDFDFNRLRTCIDHTNSSYQKVFLFEGRSPAEKLVVDPQATRLIQDAKSQINLPFSVVTEAYSMELSKNHVFYEHLKDQVKRLAVGLVYVPRPPGNPQDPFEKFELNLVLIVTEGTIRGSILANHPANLEIESGTLRSLNFDCFTQ